MFTVIRVTHRAPVTPTLGCRGRKENGGEHVQKNLNLFTEFIEVETANSFTSPTR